MTEKLFEYYETNQVGHITKGLKIIDEFGNEKCINSVREIVWLLKELNEENERLKEIIRCFKQWCKNKSINKITVENCKLIIDD